MPIGAVGNRPRQGLSATKFPPRLYATAQIERWVSHAGFRLLAGKLCCETSTWSERYIAW
jgi:hypothetical protein